MTQFSEYHGFLWPRDDGQAHGVIVDSLADLDRVLPRCKERRVAVQAGGNVGVWAKYLSSRFDAVYTAEPDNENFACLARNVTEPNVIKLQAALGAGGVPVGIDREKHNCGAHTVSNSAGIVPVLKIDDLQLRHCDLIYLDIEGYELNAIKGAYRTIQAHRPVIAFEDKGLSVKYGVEQNELRKWLEIAFSYRVVDNIANDVVMECLL